MRKTISLVTGTITAFAAVAIACSSSTPLQISDDAGGTGSSSGSSSGTGSSSGSSSDAAGSSGSSGGTGSSSGTQNGSSSGSSSGASGDAGAWINLTGNATGCDNHAGTPCGYTPTNEKQGYTCLCYNGTQSDGWGCEPAGTCVVPGASCPGSTGPVCDGGAGDADTGD